MSRRLVAGLACTGIASLVFVVLTVGCVFAESTVDQLIRLEDARNAQALIPLSRSADPDVRARAVRALGRVQSTDRAVIAALAAAAKDSDPRVQAEAVFALGQEWDPAAEGALMNQLSFSAQASDEVRMLAIEGLGKCGSVKGVETLVAVLRWPSARERAWAALALGVAAYRDSKAFPGSKPGWKATSAQIATLIKLLADTDGDVRWGAVYALYRIAYAGKAGASAAAIRDALAKAVADGDDLVSLTALQGLGELAKDVGVPDAVAAALGDQDWRVRVAAANTAGKAKDGRLDAGLVALMEDKQSLAVVAAIRAVEARRLSGAAARLDAFWKDEKAPEMVRAEALRALAAVSEEASRDALRAASLSPLWRLRRASAQGWALFIATSERREQAAQYLESLGKDDDARVRAAVLEALPEDAGVQMRGLDDPDMVVRATAAEALGKLKSAAAVPKLLATLQSLDATADVEVIMSIVDALGAIGDRSAAPALQKLALDPEANVARHARDALKALGVQPPAQAANPTPTVVPEEALAFVRKTTEAGRNGKPLTAKVVTDRGELVLKLFPEEAPLTVWNFVRLARKGYFDNITFHRVVPNFVAQTGDPRGDGWGGPGWAIRCEYNPLRYERGAVGMALAGKDTGGSQWFITHSPQPHLNGRYTIWAQLVEGGEVLDSLTEGDRILRIELSPALAK